MAKTQSRPATHSVLQRRSTARVTAWRTCHRQLHSVGVSLFLSLVIIVEPASAFALQKHSLSTAFGSFSSPTGLAVNQATNQVYIANGTKVLAYKSSGAPDAIHPELTGQNLVCPQGIAVDNSTGPNAGDIYVADQCAATVYRYNPNGEYVGIFATTHSIPNRYLGTEGTFSPIGVAVGPTGDVYITDQNNEVVDQLSLSGDFLTQFGRNNVGYNAGIAVAPSGNVYVAGYYNGLIEFTRTGACMNNCSPVDLGFESQDWVVATDEQGNVYIGGLSGSLSSYDSLGLPIEQLGPRASQIDGIAVDDSTDTVYVSEPGASEVSTFVLETVPGLEISPVTDPGPTSVTVNGQVEPASGEEITGCHFEYGASTSYGLVVPCLDQHNVEVGTPGEPIKTGTEVHAPIAGLAAGALYHYRLVTSGTGGIRESIDRVYRPEAVASLVTEAPTNVTGTSAVLHGSFVGNGEPTMYYFEWGSDGTYTGAVPLSPVSGGSPSGPNSTAVLANLEGLQPVSTYQYRIVASNGIGSSAGEGERFTTPLNAPQARHEGSSTVHADSVVLHAELNPGGADTKYHFEYGTDDVWRALMPARVRRPLMRPRVKVRASEKSVRSLLTCLLVRPTIGDWSRKT